MNLLVPLMHLGALVALELPARNLSFEKIEDDLRHEEEQINIRIARLSDGDANRRMLSHIIGIERWCQRKLETALGSDPFSGEYDEFRPDPDCSWSELAELFPATRQKTLSLVDNLARSGADLSKKIHHNQFGDLTPRAWLRYLSLHANMEIQKL